MSDANINRENKDRLFKFIFGRSENKKWTLSLYNAINGTDYSDPEEIEINTLEEAIYMGMKNDVSYILREFVNIYEHQSTFCPNMPIRSMMYAAHLYDKHIKQHKLNIYGSRQVMLPVPKLVVFYNGRTKKEDDTVLTLADAFDESVRELSDIDVRVRMLNINYGHNKAILEACRVLYDYSWFVNEIRNNCDDMDIEMAVDKAIDDMPEDAELKDFLVVHRSEVIMSCLTEYNEEETMKMFADEAREEGREEGADCLVIDQVYKKIRKGKTVDVIASEVEKSVDSIDELVKIIMTFDPKDYDVKKIQTIWKAERDRKMRS